MQVIARFDTQERVTDTLMPIRDTEARQRVAFPSLVSRTPPCRHHQLPYTVKSVRTAEAR